MVAGTIIVRLTERECQVLLELSKELDLPQERVMIQALRCYQLSRHPVNPIPMMITDTEEG